MNQDKSDMKNHTDWTGQTQIEYKMHTNRECELFGRLQMGIHPNLVELAYIHEQKSSATTSSYLLLLTVFIQPPPPLAVKYGLKQYSTTATKQLFHIQGDILTRTCQQPPME